jgi:hypothetical protein
MKRGDKIYFTRGKTRLLGTLLATYDYPAVRIKVRGLERIVRESEIEDWQLSRDKKRMARRMEKLEGLKRENKWILDLWRPGMTSAEWKAAAGGWCIGDWQRIWRLKNVGIIK